MPCSKSWMYMESIDNTELPRVLRILRMPGILKTPKIQIRYRIICLFVVQYNGNKGMIMLP